MKAVFLDTQTFNASISLESINAQVSSLITYPLTSPEQVIERCLDADIIISNKVVLDKNIIEALPRLKLVCIAATGYNNIDINAAKASNIAVTNVTGYAGQSIAQYVFAQILSYYSQPHHYQSLVSQGQWQLSPSFCIHSNPINELSGKTLSIIGFGNLGQSVAQLAQAFYLKVLIAEQKTAKNIRSGRVSFEHAIEQADILSLHCPLTDSTKNLINADTFQTMKPSAMLVNCARGGIVNEDDLLEALSNKQIAFAALDVLAQEPPAPDNKLINAKLDNLTITPHIAWASIEAQQRLIDGIAANIAAFEQNLRLNRLD